MRVTVLAYREDDGAPELDPAIGQVADALRACGHDVSTLAIHDDVTALVSGLKRSRPELVFNLVESFGDDQVGGLMGVAGVLDLLRVCYTGGGPGEIYLQEDKALAKKLLAYEDVLYPHFATFAPGADFETGGKLRMPLFVKPLRNDASMGIDARTSLVRSASDLLERVLAIQRDFQDAALAEEYIEGREFYVGVLGNDERIAFPPIEMDFSGLPDGAPHVLDARAKFDESSAEYRGTRPVIADVPDELKARLQKVALDACRALRVRDYGRVDLRLTDAGEIYVIEVNASCYLERDGEFAMAARAAGLEYPALIQRIADLAFERRGPAVQPTQPGGPAETAPREQVA
jgi:D-alanine-D-alanine ligase